MRAVVSAGSGGQKASHFSSLLERTSSAESIGIVPIRKWLRRVTEGSENGIDFARPIVVRITEGFADEQFDIESPVAVD
jgi:hypothetical protein